MEPTQQTTNPAPPVWNYPTSNTARVLCTQADDVLASGSAASAFGSPLKKQLRVVSDLADGVSESASKKSSKFDDNHIAEERLFHESVMPDAEEEESDAVESPKKKRKVISEEEKAAIKAKKEA